MKARFHIVCLLLLFSSAGCEHTKEVNAQTEISSEDTIQTMAEKKPAPPPELTADDIVISKELLYNKYTLDDVYPYKDTTRSFKWEAIKEQLAFIENIQRDTNIRWVVMQNYKNRNREAPLVHKYRRNAYKRIADTLGVERYQSVPLYLPSDTLIPERYGPDGTLARIEKEVGSFVMISPATIEGKWLVPPRYIKQLPDSTVFHHAIFVDRGDQNITTLERISEGKWIVRSMNPATTGRHRPPYAQETPLGLFLLQEKKQRMVFLKDGSKETGGFAPYASRFTNGAYIHGVPVNVPQKALIEYSYSLGTTPRSHMCVRNATSHSEFIYKWAPTQQTVIIVIE